MKAVYIFAIISLAARALGAPNEDPSRGKLDSFGLVDYNTEHKVEKDVDDNSGIMTEDLKPETEENDAVYDDWDIMDEDLKPESEEEMKLEKILEETDLEELQRELEKSGAQTKLKHGKPNVVCLLRALGTYFRCARDLGESHNRPLYICAVKNWRKFGRCLSRN